MNGEKVNDYPWYKIVAGGEILQALEDFEQANSFFKSKDGKEQLWRGNVPGYHLLAACEVDGMQQGIRVVDFRTVFSLPLLF